MLVRDVILLWERQQEANRACAVVSQAYVMDVVFHPSVVAPALPQEEPKEHDNAARRRVALGRSVRA